MMHFVTQALEDKTAKSETEWCDLVRREWSMECEFDRGIERDLLVASWSMGELRFDAMDLSGQRWSWKPGPGLDGWRASALVMFMAESGAMEVEQDEKNISLTGQSLLILDGNIRYTLSTGINARVVALRIPKTSLQTRGKLLSGREMFVPDSTSPDVALIKSLVASATAYGEQCSSHGGRLVAEHLMDLMEIITGDSQAKKRVVRSDVTLRKVKRFILRNLANESMNLDSIANAIGVSKRQIMRLFERDGSSAMRYLLEQRLEKARKILTHGGDGLRVSDVAWQCGFVSLAHFSRAFKKQYGESPMEFQRDEVAPAKGKGGVSAATSTEPCPSCGT
jgi:AraC-like DNA-binding protein